ncbi:EAL domain-containing protein [Herbaspirillum sp. GCM10030257]|uniref:bifunctional diguanylate cyclase/phosphodiesterase n=1 Tax=Herbaspirillum sp. GCM10030257 TaxID=3273393 RepID=UPI00361788BD
MNRGIDQAESTNHADPTATTRKPLSLPEVSRGMLPVILWPAISLLLATLLWVTTAITLTDERREAEISALAEAKALSQTYSEYIARAVEQIDQLTLLIRYQWERSRQSLRLEDLSSQGAFPMAHYALTTVINAEGRPVTANRPMGSVLMQFNDRDYFVYHRDNPSRALRIGTPIVGRVSQVPVIQFTRRLEREDGSFDGVVLVSVTPGYLTGFFDGSRLGRLGMLAVVDADSIMLAYKIGTSISEDESYASSNALRGIPPFSASQQNGSLIGPEWFPDKRPRYAAMIPVAGYPLIGVAGIAQEEYLLSYAQTRRNILQAAIVASVILLLFSALGSAWSFRRVRHKQQQLEVQETYRLATEGGNEGFYMLRAIRDRAGNVVDFEVVDCNERGAWFYGSCREQFVGARLSQLNGPAYFPVVMELYRSALQSGFYEDEAKIPPGSPIVVEWVHRRLVRSGAGLAITFRDISHIKAHERELSRMANEDALTFLPNRNWLKHHLPGMLDVARQSGSALALMFVDLDNFKNVNDSHGHSAGDELLRSAAERLKSLVRPGDHVVRLGGDEFTVILHPVEHQDEIAIAATRISQAFHHPFDLVHGKHAIGASIGISIFPRDGYDAEALLKNADIAMYQAKSDGKGHFRYYEQSLAERLKARLDMERSLQLALSQNQFVLHYQPRVDTLTGELRSLEALVRWKHPDLGLVPPLEFIPLAEETGMILRLGELVLEEACAQISRWKAMSLKLVPVSINVSPYQFNHGDIHHTVTACLQRHRVEPGLVEIEITESSMMGEHAEVSAEMTALRAMGVKLLVDDFGTGFSSLSQLQRLEMDGLKVDRAFTSELVKKPEGEVFFRAIMSMAHALGMSVVAEGVETEEQLQALRAMACDEVQGYFISHPVPAADAQALLQRRFLLSSHDEAALTAT